MSVFEWTQLIELSMINAALSTTHYYYTIVLFSSFRLSNLITLASWTNKRAQFDGMYKTRNMLWLHSYTYLSLWHNIHSQHWLALESFTGWRQLAHTFLRHVSHNSALLNSHQNSIPHRTHLSSFSGTTNFLNLSTSHWSFLETR